MSLDGESIAEQLRTQQSSLRAFARQEFAAQRENMRRTWAMDEAVRVREGHCIAGLRFERRTEAGHWHFRIGEDATDFREGDFLRLHTGDPLKPVTECSLVLTDPEWLLIDPFKRHIEPEVGVDYVLDQSYFDLESMVLQAIDELGATIRGREKILPLLLGDTIPDEVDAGSYEETLTQSEAQGFNDSQADAIANATACDWCSLIQGPPGTGKTRVLAQIVANRLAQGERILITAFTHRAIHQALTTLKQLLPIEERIIKVGGILPDPDLPVPQYEFFADSPLAESNPGEGYVVGATVFACRSQRLKGYDFDTLVIDEASQMTLMHAVLGMLSSDRYIIIGDPEQLPPVLQSIASSECKAHSIFQSLNRTADLVRLNTTYRMNATITEWSSEQFYHGQLQSHASSAGRQLPSVLEAEEAAWIQQALDPEVPIVWIEHPTTACRHFCMEEVDLVHQLISALLRSGFPSEQIAVLTPFRKQARAIRRRLRASTELGQGFAEQIVVDTVERMQGQERELVLLSCSANEPSFVRSVADFLFLPARLNVSITRARSKAIVLAGQTLLQADLDDTELNEMLAPWRSLREASTILEV